MGKTIELVVVEVIDFIKTKFEYYLVSFWMLVFVCVVMRLVGVPDAIKALDWAFNAFSALLGALLGLIQGSRLAQRKTEGNGNGAATPPAPTPPPDVPAVMGAAAGK